MTTTGTSAATSASARATAQQREVRVRQQRFAALDALDELEVHLRQIVVEHQRRDPRLIHLEGEYDEIEHDFD